MFHYLFPPLTIGMGVVLVYLEGMYLWTRQAIYEDAARFWTKIFAVNFAIGVATGIVMEFEFGTNWAMYSRFVGDVFGSALAAEGIFAFFLESGFLAVLVFGWDRVGAKFHFVATVMVALGSIFSSIWITVANSWQQTPAGHHIVAMQRDGQPWIIDGEPIRRAEIVDFWAMVFNPSSIHRLVHVCARRSCSACNQNLKRSPLSLPASSHLRYAASRIACCSSLGAAILARVMAGLRS
jgi:cytochrome d ubiquinol oxidase subunit I